MVQDVRANRERARLIKQTKQEIAELGIDYWARCNLAVDLAVRAQQVVAANTASRFVAPAERT